MIPTIVTNNPRVERELFGQDKIEIKYFADASQEEILRFARDRIHLGAKLIIHPMMGRIKPHETPYKSVFLDVPSKKETENGNLNLDFESITIIEDSISETSKLLNNTYMIKYDKNNLSNMEDLAYIDYLLVSSGIEEYLR